MTMSWPRSTPLPVPQNHKMDPNNSIGVVGSRSSGDPGTSSRNPYSDSIIIRSVSPAASYSSNPADVYPRSTFQPEEVGEINQPRRYILNSTSTTTTPLLNIEPYPRRLFVEPYLYGTLSGSREPPQRRRPSTPPPGRSQTLNRSWRETTKLPVPIQIDTHQKSKKDADWISTKTTVPNVDNSSKKCGYSSVSKISTKLPDIEMDETDNNACIESQRQLKPQTLSATSTSSTRRPSLIPGDINMKFFITSPGILKILQFIVGITLSVMKTPLYLSIVVYLAVISTLFWTWVNYSSVNLNSKGRINNYWRNIEMLCVNDCCISYFITTAFTCYSSFGPSTTDAGGATAVGPWTFALSCIATLLYGMESAVLCWKSFH